MKQHNQMILLILVLFLKNTNSSKMNKAKDINTEKSYDLSRLSYSNFNGENNEAENKKKKKIKGKKIEDDLFIGFKLYNENKIIVNEFLKNGREITEEEIATAAGLGIFFLLMFVLQILNFALLPVFCFIGYVDCKDCGWVILLYAFLPFISFIIILCLRYNNNSEINKVKLIKKRQQQDSINNFLVHHEV